MFTTIAIIGTGNIGSWLIKILQNQNNISVVSLSGREAGDMPNHYDLYIFALKDDIYEDILKQIPFKMSRAVHTSGSLSQNILAPYSEKFGVLYPYQTITSNNEIRKSDDFPLVPLCIEGCDFEFEEILYQWASSLFSSVYKISEKQRFAMHLAAVFANNFTNAMYGIAYQIFKENCLEWSLIFPLLEHTLEKAMKNKPSLVQTGPAKRNDVSIMQKHFDALNDEELRKLYSTLSTIIQRSTYI